MDDNQVMSAVIENRFGPSDLAPEEQLRLEQMVLREVRPVLLTEGGDVIELPKAMNDLFVSVMEAMKRKEAVFLMHESEAFTTQAAANVLGVSRQYLVRLLEEGKDSLPPHRDASAGFLQGHRSLPARAQPQPPGRA